MAQEPEVVCDQLRDRAPACSGVTMGSEEAGPDADSIRMKHLPGVEVGVHEEASSGPHRGPESTGAMGLQEPLGAFLQGSRGDTDVCIKPEEDLFEGSTVLGGAQGCWLAAVGVVKDEESVTTLTGRGSPRAGRGRCLIRTAVAADSDVEPNAVLRDKVGQEARQAFPFVVGRDDDRSPQLDIRHGPRLHLSELA